MATPIPEAPWRGMRPDSAPGTEPKAPLTPRPQTSASTPRHGKLKASMDSTVYMPRGASTQAISIKKAAPIYGFGSATREQANKVFVSQEHTLIALGGSDSPGPAGYILPPSVGGKQPNGKMADPPVWAFGTANRFQIGKSEKKPGPDEYKMYPSIGGNQPDGARENAPEWGFGTATRDQINKLFISQEHTLTILAGTQSPGPACYTLPKSVSAEAAAAQHSTRARAPK